MSDEPTVQVTGHGSASTVPDRVRLHLASVARATEVGEAFERADTAAKAMLAALRAHDVADEDIRTSHIGVESHHDAPGMASGFRASMGIEVMLRDIPAAGRAVSAAVDAGGKASRVHRLSLASSAPDQAMAQAREAAWTNALDRARQYARLAGRELGAVLEVKEASRPGHHGEPMAFAASSAAGIEPGTQTLHAAVTVRWQLI